MRFFKPGDAWGLYFAVLSSTGAAVNADSTPTVSLKKNGVADGAVTFTLTNPATGEYYATCTIPSGYAAGDKLAFVVSATVGGIATKMTIEHIRLVACDITDAAALGLTRLDAAVSSRSTYAGGAVASVTAGVTLASSEHTAISGTDVPAALTAQGYTTTRAGYLDVLNGIVAAIWAAATRTLTAFGFTPNVGNVTGTIPNATIGGYASGQDPATLVLDTAQSGHNTAGTIGNKIGAAASAGDPWTTALPGSYGAGSAGNIVGNRLDVAVGTRNSVAPDNATIAAIASYVDTEVAAIKAKTDQLIFTGANVNSAAQNLPGDYQQRAVAVTLPTTPPAGYGGGGSAPTVGQIRAEIDANSTALALLLALFTNAKGTLSSDKLSGTIQVYPKGTPQTGTPLATIPVSRASADDFFSLNLTS